jgi:hypothetical protein
MSPPTRSVVAAMVTALAMAGGCGDDPAGDVTQPPIHAGSEDIAPALSPIDLPPRSQPFGAASTSGHVVAQTFQTSGYTPDGVVAFFDGHLADDGWSRTSTRQREAGPGRADYVRGEQRLEVSAAPVPMERGIGSEQAIVQFSLVLHQER